jgi:EAL domain-containing protein (putative c-di-GMP-specific phosphodiesterase class I)
MANPQDQQPHTETDPTSFLSRIVEQACDLLDAADGASVLMLSEGELRTIATSNIAANPPGRVIPVETPFAQRVLTSRAPLCFDDILNDERLSPHYRGDGRTRSVIVVPLFDGAQPVGLLAVISRRPAAFSGEDICTLMRVCDFAGVAVAASMQTADAARAVLEAMRSPMILPDAAGDLAARTGDGPRVREFLAEVVQPGTIARRRTLQRVRDALVGSELSCAVQPVIRLSDGRLDSAEALARFSGLPRRGPDVWFAEAHSVGLGIELETLAVRRAVQVLDAMPELPSIGINVTPRMLLSGELQRLLGERSGERITIELTEHLAVDDYPAARAVVHELRSLGVRLAIDDVGAGYSSFRHVVELEPDSIKLDRSFIAGFESRRVWAEMAQALVDVAHKMGAKLVAEGIETEAQLVIARRLGVDLGQGYLFARPGPPEQMPTRFDHLAATGVRRPHVA